MELREIQEIRRKIHVGRMASAMMMISKMIEIGKIHLSTLVVHEVTY